MLVFLSNIFCMRVFIVASDIDDVGDDACSVMVSFVVVGMLVVVAGILCVVVVYVGIRASPE